MALLDQTADGLAAAVSGPAAGPVAADDGGERASWFQVGPLVVVLTLFFGLPMLVVLAVSFFDFDRSDIIPAFIFDNYVELFRSEVTLRLYTSSIKFALIVWAVTFVLGFNVAYFLVFHVRGTLWQIALFLLCTVPFLTSNIIRMISWIPFLGRNGIFNQALVGSGAVQQPLEFLLFSDFAVIVAYVHLFTLFMVVPIFNSMARIDKSLLEAAHDAGASRFRVVYEIVLPLSKSGIALGLDLRDHPGHGRFLRRAHHERRPERVGRLGAAERGRRAAISAGRRERRHHGDHRHPDGGGDPAPGRCPQGTGALRRHHAVR